MKRRDGFTIVELLIVIVVIAILAAVMIVAYVGIQKRTQDASLKSDLSQAGRIMTAWFVDNSIADLRTIYGGSGAAYSGGKESDNALTTSLRWDDLDGVPEIPVSPTSTVEVIAAYKGENAAIAPAANNRMLQNNSFCLTAASKGGTYNYRIMSAIPAQYDKLLYYDSVVGRVATLQELGKLYDDGTEITCEAHLLRWRAATP